jgi:hypothetical protein
LIPIGGSPFAAPDAVCLDSTLLMQDGTVLAASDEAGHLYVYTVNAATGALTLTKESPHPVGDKSTATTDGLRIYLPERGGTVEVYAVSATGVVTAHASSPFVAPQAEDPNPIELTADHLRLYLGQYGEDGLWGFDVDATGALALLDGAPWSTDSVNGLGAMQFTPDGAFLVAVNELDPWISVFSVAQDGAVAHVDGSPFALDELDCEPSGLVVAE